MSNAHASSKLKTDVRAIPLPKIVDPAGSDSKAQVLPLIERLESEEIRVGAGGKLLVPREEIDGEIDESSELDLVGMLPLKVRKPGRREWIALNPTSELTTRMLLHKPMSDGIEVEHYYVTLGLRASILEELKAVRVFVYYSFTTKTHALWVVTVTPENSWYESQAMLFQKPSDFFVSHAVRVFSDRANSRYRVMIKPIPAQVPWPDRSTELLLGEALGAARFITSPDHPVYRDLTEGTELD
jgi:hypothetical protein